MKDSVKLAERAGLLLLAMAVAVPAWRSSGNGSGMCSLPIHVSGLIPVASAAALPAQIWNKDPLTEQEADQLRETADQPDKRMELLAEFATARMAKVDEALTSKPASSRGKRIHDALDEFGRLLDEVDDNIDDYLSRRMDMRKGLAKVIEADTEFQAKLAALKEKAANSSATDTRDDYEFVLQDDMDIVKGQLQNAKDAVEEQERQIQEEKERQKQRERQTYNPIPQGR